MKARPWNWVVFGLALILSCIGILGIALLLNLTGDCPPQVTNCGEPQRRASFIVLGLGVLWLAYVIVTFIRSPDKFR